MQRLFDILPVSSISGAQDRPYMVGISSYGEGYLYKFYSEYSIPSKLIYKIVRIIFSLTFASCVVAVEIVLSEIKDTDTQSDGSFVTDCIWPLISLILYSSLILVQPFLILFCLLNKFFDDKMQIDKSAMLTAALTAAWIIFLYLLVYGPFGHTTNLLTKLSIVGVTIMSLLSGLASVSTPYYTLMYLLRKNRTSDPNSIKYIIPDLWLNSQTISDRITEYEEQVNEILGELNHLQELEKSNDLLSREKLADQLGRYQLELVRLRNKAKDCKVIRTFKRIFQSIFLLYCIFKLFNVFMVRIPAVFTHTWAGTSDSDYERLEKEREERDPLAITIANALDFFLFQFNYQQELDSLIRQISLILSISLFVCSLSTVTTTISSLLTLLPVKLQVLALSTLQSRGRDLDLPAHKNEVLYSRHEPSIIKNLLVSELTGVYILATILMIRSNLPFDVSVRLHELLGERFTISSILIDIWSDKVFAFSAICTFIGIKIAERTLSK